MGDNINIDLKGHIEVYQDEQLILSEPNAITNNAIHVILSSLGTQINNGIDILRVKVGTQTIDKPILESTVDINDNSITFTTILVENDFNGVINQLYLHSSLLDKSFSSKTGLSILKDDNMRIKIKWKITINKV